MKITINGKTIETMLEREQKKFDTLDLTNKAISFTVLAGLVALVITKYMKLSQVAFLYTQDAYPEAIDGLSNIVISATII
jgi:hypothetical protein